MTALLVLAVVSFLLFRLLGGAPQLRIRRHNTAQSQDAKIEELSEYASRLRATNKYTSAEKVYLQILKIDHRHTATYSRLGTLYVAMKNLSDAIECFEIATQLSPSGRTFYNLGLAYYENKNPMKAIAALEKSVMFEPSAQSYIGLAKAFSKLNNGDKVIEVLEQAAELESQPKVLWLLADAYEAAGRYDEADEIAARVKNVSPRDPRLRTFRNRPRPPRVPVA